MKQFKLSSNGYKAIAIDVDGTLLNSKHQLDPQTKEKLAELHKRGIRIIIASGRMAARIKPYREELGFPISVVGFNGGRVFETIPGSGENNWECTYQVDVNIKTREAVYSICHKKNLFLNIYTEDELFCFQPQGDFSWSEHYSGHTQSRYSQMFQDLNQLPRVSLAKLLIIESPENREKLFTELKPLLQAHCQVMKSNPEYLEFLPQNASKGEALRHWLTKNEIEAAELCAFGDAENDLEMLQLAGCGIAMANSTPGLIKGFSRISKWTNDENAVVQELEQIFS